MTAAGEVLDTCEVHGQPLLEDAIPVFQARCVEVDPGFETVRERHFPHAGTFVWGEGLPDPYPVRYCPACREAEGAWARAPGEWGEKARRMRRGYDPLRGTPATLLQATIVTDYVWIERWARVFHDLGMLNDFAPFGSLEEYVRGMAAKARADGAPLDATHREGGRWRTIGEIRNRRLLEAMGVEPERS